MRQLRHKAIGLSFWFLLAACWVMLVREHKVGTENITYSVTYIAVIGGAVLAITLWWVRHNTAIFHRKGPRTGRPGVAPRTDEDRLGRPLRWQFAGGAPDALEVSHLVIDLDGTAKVYVEAR